MKNNLITAVDLGTSAIRVVVAEDDPRQPIPTIVAAVELPSAGIRRRTVMEPEETAAILTEAFEQIRLQSGAQIDSLTISLGGIDMGVRTSKGVVVVGRSGGEIASDDMERAVVAAQAVSIPANKEIVHVLPRTWTIDDQSGITDPVGMTGVRLEVEALIVDVSVPVLRGAEAAVEISGANIDEAVCAPLAVAEAVLNKQQKELGVVAVDIGAPATSLTVYEEGELIHTAILPVGAAHITNDLAIGLRTDVEIAEKVKLRYGTALPESVDRREECDLSAIDPREEGLIPRYHIAEIIGARMEEIFSLVQDELIRIGKAELLPAGAVLSGGGSKLPHTVALAKEKLRLPVRPAEPRALPGIFDKVDDPAFATALGLLWWRINHERSEENSFVGKSARKLTKPLALVGRKIHNLMEKFLP